MVQQRTIPHVSWRNGRPRFQPSKTLRAMNFEGFDLRVNDQGQIDPEGRFMSRGEAADWSRSFQKKLKKLRQEKARKKSGRRAPSVITVAQLVNDWQNPALNRKFRKEDHVTGKRRERPLARNTQIDYLNKAQAFADHDPVFFNSAVRALDNQILNGLFNELWEIRGLSMARGMMAVLRTALRWGRLHYPELKKVDPFNGLRFETPQPRVRIASKQDFAALVACADGLGWPEIGDMIYLAIFTGQRQGDRLTMTYTGLETLRQKLKQNKRGARVDFKLAAPLIKRLEANRERRSKAGVTSDIIILNERTWQPFVPDFYRRHFAEIRQFLSWRPGCAAMGDFYEMDLRDTAVTWMALGGATLPEIVAVTGHSLQSASIILEHYLARTPELADSAIDKMTDWFESSQDIAI